MRTLINAAIILLVFEVCPGQIATRFEFPTDNYVLSLGQSPRFFLFGDPNPRYGNKLHAAEDIRASSPGMAVQAAGAGKVMLAREWKCCPSWGHILVIEHTLPEGGKVSSIYAHLDPATVAVSEGQDIGQPGVFLGRTGSYSCWDEHLHFGIHLGEFDVAIGSHPTWLSGYLDPPKFPGSYRRPSDFIRERQLSEPPPEPQLIAQGIVDNPSISLSNDNRIHVTWTQDGQVLYANSDDNANSFSEPRDLTIDLPFRKFATDMTVTDQGGLFLAWQAPPPPPGDSSQSDIFLARSSDNGTSFIEDALGTLDPTNVSNDGGLSTGASIAAQNNFLYAAWQDIDPSNIISRRIFFARSTDGGTSFGPAEELFADFFIRHSPVVAVSNSGVLAVACPAFEPPNFTESRVLVVFSQDNGVSFTTPEPIDNVPGREANVHSIAFDSDGTLHVVWHSGPFGSLGPHSIEYSRSEGDPQAVSFPVRRTIKENASLSSSPTIALGPQNQIAIVFNDGSGRDRDLFVSRAENPTDSDFSIPIKFFNSDIGQFPFASSVSPKIAFAPSGVLWAVWTEGKNFGFRQILVWVVP